jgi:hypothetical protein
VDEAMKEQGTKRSLVGKGIIHDLNTLSKTTLIWANLYFTAWPMFLANIYEFSKGFGTFRGIITV